MKKEVGAGSPGALGERRPRVHTGPSWGLLRLSSCRPPPGSVPRPPSDPLASLRLSGSKSSWPKRQLACSLLDSGGPGPLLWVASGPAGLSTLSLGSGGSSRRWRTGRAPSSSPALRPGLSSAKVGVGHSERPLARRLPDPAPRVAATSSHWYPRLVASGLPGQAPLAAAATYLPGQGLSSCQPGWPSGTPTSDPQGSPALGGPAERRQGVSVCVAGAPQGQARSRGQGRQRETAKAVLPAPGPTCSRCRNGQKDPPSPHLAVLTPTHFL